MPAGGVSVGSYVVLFDFYVSKMLLTVDLIRDFLLELTSLTLLITT